MAAPPGPALSEFLNTAAGNPSAIRALLDSVVQADALRRGAGVVDLDPESSFDKWNALTTVVLRRLDVLSAETKEMSHWAALLGDEFELGDVAVVMHVPPTDLVRAVDEATAAAVLVDTEGRLAFRDRAIRRILYEQRSLAVRMALHREAAEALAESGVPAERVAAQLLAAVPTYDAWTVRWLLDNIDAVASRDPVTAVDLLAHATASTSIADDDRDTLAVRRVRWLFRLGRRPAAEARAALATTRNVEHAAEMRFLLARLVFQSGDPTGAIADLRQAEQDPSVPDFWTARYQTLRARFERTGLDDLDAAERTAITALETATSVADPKATANALQELWYVATVHRDHTAALDHIDRALAAVAGDPELAMWQLDFLDNRTFTLQNLDRLAEASETLARTRVLATRLHHPVGRPHVATAVHYYWLGRWDDALAELDLVAENGPESAYFDLRIQAPLLQHGVGARIAAHRGDADALRSHLDTASAYPLTGVGEQENSDFLVVARAIDTGQRVDGEAALDALAPLLDPNYGRMTLRHQWLPDLIRLALDIGDHEQAQAALELCRTEAARETTPARANAALARCQALVDGDPEPLLATADYYAQIGRRVEMATTLADAAVLLARRDEIDRAQRTLDDAMGIFGELGAVFDISQVDARLNQHGLQHVITARHRPTVAGWAALSELERLIAELVAAEKTNADIATAMGLSRRTVQLHLSRIMQKLGAQSRAEFAVKASEALAVSGGQHTVPDKGRT
jgi:DNA-binding CsgD family transcriptional regulator